MKVTEHNWQEVYNKISLDKLAPEDQESIKEAAGIFLDVEAEGQSMANLSSPEFKGLAKGLIADLQEFYDAQYPAKTKPKAKTARKTAKPKSKAKPKPAPKVAKPKRQTAKRELAKPTAVKKQSRTPSKTFDGKWVRSFSVELALIKRFVAMLGKDKTRKQVLLLIKAVQRAILKGDVRKTNNPSPYWQHIDTIQKKTINFFNSKLDTLSDTATARVDLRGEDIEAMKSTVERFRKFPSVGYAMRFITLSGQNADKEKAAKLATAIDKKIISGAIGPDDPLRSHMERVVMLLRNYLAGKQDSPMVVTATLSGLAAAVYDCGCGKPNSTINGLPTQNVRYNAAEIRKMNFKTFRLPGELGRFLGELDGYKTAFALTGDSGAGKSYFSFSLAKLFLNAGFSIIYYTLEEGQGKLLQKKLNHYDIGPEMEIAEYGTLADVKRDAEVYDVVIVDSFGKLGAKPADFDRLRQEHPNTIFICIFQKRDDGKIRGGSSITFDSSATIDVMVQDKQRVAIMKKSRHGTIGWVYSIDKGRIIQKY